MIPITVVRLGDEEEALVLEVLRSGGLAQGEKVGRFEKEFARLSGVEHAIAVNNGTTSLVAALEVMGLRPGDEVITSPFTFVATLNAILEAGATATFADILDDDFAIDPVAIRGVITDRTRVLMPVHLYGQMADMAAISTLAQERDLRVIEDAAQSHGARRGAFAAGAFDVGSFSFYATKNITTGEGGVITTNDDALADKLRVLRNQGMRARYQYEMAGHNYRMTELQAAIGIPQIERYEHIVRARRHNAEYLSSRLRDVVGVVPPVVSEGSEHVWHQYTVRVTGESGVGRDEFVERLHEAGVGSGVYYPKLVLDYEPYANRPDVRVGDFPVARRVASEVVSLPVHPLLSERDLEVVADAAIAAAVPR